MRKQGHNGQYQLQDSFFRPVNQGDCVTDKWNDTWVIDGGAPPHNSGSTGKVYVTHRHENYARVFYPDVLGLKWVLQSELSVAVDAAVAVVGFAAGLLASDSPAKEDRPVGNTPEPLQSGGGGDFGGGGADDSYAAPDSDSNTSGD